MEYHVYTTWNIKKIENPVYVYIYLCVYTYIYVYPSKSHQIARKHAARIELAQVSSVNNYSSSVQIGRRVLVQRRNGNICTEAHKCHMQTNASHCGPSFEGIWTYHNTLSKPLWKQSIGYFAHWIMTFI